MDEQLQMLKELTDAAGVPGQEHQARAVMRKYIEPYADEVLQDRIGSLIAIQHGTKDSVPSGNGAAPPKIMIAGHLDEVGFMVTRIDDNGFIYFQTLGGWWEQVMLAQRVTVMTREGALPGVIGSKPPHVLSPEARKKPVDKKDMFIDIGATSKEMALEFGVRPGDAILPVCDFTVMKNEKLLLAKAWDNRIGCAIAIEVLKRLKDQAHPNTVYGVGTVQEEVGLRGARTAANVVKPDIGFAVDVGIAGDTPGITDKEALSKMGDGPQIVIYDRSMVGHQRLLQFVTDTADSCSIPYQYDFMEGGGTDAGSIHLSGDGVPTIAVTIPTRYIHSHASMLHRDDYEHAVQLMVEVAKRLDRKAVEEITYG